MCLLEQLKVGTELPQVGCWMEALINPLSGVRPLWLGSSWSIHLPSGVGNLVKAV